LLRIYTYIYTYVYTYVHTYLNMFIRSYVHLYINTYVYTYILHRLKSSGIFQYVASLENEHDSFREIHLSLVYVWSFMTFRSFVYKLHSFKTLLSPSVCTFTITHRHTRPWAMSKLEQLRFELIAHPPYSSDLAPSDYSLFPNLKRWLQRKRFTSNEEVIAETEAYFEDLDVSYYRKDIEMLENRYTITLEGNYGWGINIILPKKRLFSLKIPGLFSPYSIYIRLYIHLYIHLYVHTFIRTFIRIYIRLYIQYKLIEFLILKTILHKTIDN